MNTPKQCDKATASTTGIETAEIAQTVILPVAEETFWVEKREVEKGKVIVRVTPEQHTKTIEASLTDETAEVERVAINREVESIEPPREEGDVTVIPIYEEVLVVEKRLMLKEEVRIRRRRTERVEMRDIDLRKENVKVTRVDAAGVESALPGTQAASTQQK